MARDIEVFVYGPNGILKVVVKDTAKVEYNKYGLHFLNNEDQPLASFRDYLYFVALED